MNKKEEEISNRKKYCPFVQLKECDDFCAWFDIDRECCKILTLLGDIRTTISLSLNQIENAIKG